MSTTGGHTSEATRCAERLMREAYGDGRPSPQRRALAEAVLGFPGAFSTDDLAIAARRCLPRLSTATVYRAVGAMADAGFIAPVGSADGATLWARCYVSGHHHHAVCESCGALVCLACPLPDVDFEHVVDGFRVRSHEFRLYGICASCGERSGETP